MGLRRIGLMGAAIAFARSDRGKRTIAAARRKYDTPENRAKVGEAIKDASKSLGNRGRPTHRAH